MLKTIPDILTPDTLWTLAAMGHGDSLTIADRNYPAHSTTPTHRVQYYGSASSAEILAAVAQLLPVDDFAEPNFAFMVPDYDPLARFPIHDQAIAIIEGSDHRAVAAHGVPRTAFYAKARQSFATIVTGESQPYGCFILTKGVVSATDGGI